MSWAFFICYFLSNHPLQSSFAMCQNVCKAIYVVCFACVESVSTFITVTCQMFRSNVVINPINTSFQL
jgi:hypothetical protein